MSQKNKKQKGWIVLVPLIAAAALAVVALMMKMFDPKNPAPRPNQTTWPQTTAVPTTEPENTSPAPTVQAQLQEFAPINLGYGLTITDVGSYNGSYMEDGSDEFVSGVMMIVVSNDGDDDIQLADIELSWSGGLYSFRLTDLPAGSRAVLLELSRSTCPAGVPQSAIARDVAVFSGPMELREERIRISGLDGMMNVKNISGTDISGDIYVYYKYAADDIFYGGITFRVRVEGGLTVGEIRQVPAGHYSPEACAIVHIECYG